MPTRLSRREFMRLCAGSAAGIAMSGLLAPYLAEAAEAGLPPVIWIQGASCTGCAVSLLNTVHPDIENVLLKIISLRYQPNVMAAAGDLAINEALFKTAAENKGKFYLVVEGAVPTGADGLFCTVGERDGKPITFTSMLAELASQAAAVLNFGTCSCFGGIPAADPNPTGCVSVPEFLKGKNITMINVPGCPPHPDWMVGTIAQVLLYGLPEVDTFGRPTMFFGRMIHDNCERRQYFDNGIFAEKFGDPGCMLQLGCKGPLAYCDASTRGWNNGVNWCVRCGGTCVGCTDPEFPNWTMYERMSELAAWPTISASADTIGLVLGAATALGIGGHLAGNVFAGRFKGKPHEEE